MGDDGQTCRHYQGLVRTNGPGTPYMVINRSGKDVYELGQETVAANKAYQSALAATDNASPGRHLLQLKYDSTLVAANAAGDVE